MLDQKWNDTMLVYDEYEKRFAAARLTKKLREPWKEHVREDVILEVKKMLGFDESLIPEIHGMEEVSRHTYTGYDVIGLKYSTWKSFSACGSLFMPHAREKVPLVFVLCGHGEDGRLSSFYVRMAQKLAEMGMAVMLPDNIGQGDRRALGHYDAIAPFYCGLTLQGLIVMETVALIRYMRKDPRFDSTRIGSCGNSGGGTLNMFLAALAPEISAISASGYPSEFAYIFSKERYHCACNLLPGAAHGPEMWEILSVFAPKPMMLESGKNDSLIPIDHVHRNARKVHNVYLQKNAAESFRYVATETKHSWEPEDRYEIAKFFSEVFGTDTPAATESDLPDTSKWSIKIDGNSLTVNELAEELSRIKMPSDCSLADIYKPTYRGELIRGEDIVADLGRGEVMRILAQMECALLK